MRICVKFILLATGNTDGDIGPKLGSKIDASPYSCASTKVVVAQRNYT